MELTDLPMFGLVKKRLSWLNQRQEVIAQNVANADTPNYASRDLKAFDFQAELRREKHQGNPTTTPVNMTVTDPKHIAKAGMGAARDFKETVDRRPYETAPDGNQVVLEEQMLRMNETQTNHATMTQLYKKHMALFKMVIRSPSGG
jgi:flagellar basal-body rod protein FlgB